MEDGIPTTSNSGHPSLACGSNASNDTVLQPIMVKAEKRSVGRLSQPMGRLLHRQSRSEVIGGSKGRQLEGREDFCRRASVVFWSVTNILMFRRNIVHFSNRYFNEHSSTRD